MHDADKNQVEIEVYSKADHTCPGNDFEWRDSAKNMTRYDYSGGQRAALRRGA